MESESPRLSMSSAPAFLKRMLLFFIVSVGMITGCAEECPPTEYPKGERLYPLVTGICCWVGDNNDIWLGDRVVQVRMRFRDDAQAEAFADQRYEVGGTPSALNNMHAYNAAPCMYAVGELTPPDATEMRREGKGARPLLHIKHWVTVVPYLCNKHEALVDWMPLEVEIKAHIISGALPQAAYIRHEYKIAEYSPEELADEQMHRGLYPVVGMEAGTKKATVVPARTVADTFTCPVQFTDKEQAESFFTAEHCAEIEQARQAGLPPVLYFIGRYDRAQKVFLAERWMQAADIASDIEQLEQLPHASPGSPARDKASCAPN